MGKEDKNQVHSSYKTDAHLYMHRSGNQKIVAHNHNRPANTRSNCLDSQKEKSKPASKAAFSKTTHSRTYRYIASKCTPVFPATDRTPSVASRLYQLLS